MLPDSVKAQFVGTNGTYLEAEISIDGTSYFVMDELTVDGKHAPKPGQEFDFEFSNFLDEDEQWESMFAGNPGHSLSGNFNNQKTVISGLQGATAGRPIVLRPHQAPA